MTAGFAPHRETANLPARQFGRPPKSAHPIFRDNPSYWNFKRQSRGAERRGARGSKAPDELLDCFTSLAMTALVDPITLQRKLPSMPTKSRPSALERLWWQDMQLDGGSWK